MQKNANQSMLSFFYAHLLKNGKNSLPVGTDR